MNFNGGSSELSNPLTEDLDADGNKIINLADGVNPNDAVNLSQIPTPASITDLQDKTQNINLSTSANITNIDGVVNIADTTAGLNVNGVTQSAVQLTTTTTGNLFVSSDSGKTLSWNNSSTGNILEYAQTTDVLTIAKELHLSEDVNTDKDVICKALNAYDTASQVNIFDTGAGNKKWALAVDGGLFKVSESGVQSWITIAETTGLTTVRDVVPHTTGTYDLGSTSNKFQDLHLSGTVETPQINLSGDNLVVGKSTNVFDIGDTNGVERFGCNSFITRYLSAPIVTGVQTFWLDVQVAERTNHTSTYYDISTSGCLGNGTFSYGGHATGTLRRVTSSSSTWTHISLSNDVSGLTITPYTGGALAAGLMRFIVVTDSITSGNGNWYNWISLKLSGLNIESYTYTQQ